MTYKILLGILSLFSVIYLIKRYRRLCIEMSQLSVTNKKREDEIHYLNRHDRLTGLYNHAFFEEEKKRFDEESNIPMSVIIADINGLKLINNRMGHAEGDKYLLAMANILRHCSKKNYILARTTCNEFSILMPHENYEDTCKIIKQIKMLCEEYKIKTNEEVYPISISIGCATKSHNNENLNDIINQAEEHMYCHKLLQKESLHSKIIATMKTTLYEKSKETEEHAYRLIKLSKALGQKMNLKDKQVNELEVLAILHDLGKICISDSILSKPDKLTEIEWRQIKKHPEIGYRIALASPKLAPIAEYILYHHERYDGNGYPYGIGGEQIPLLSRIIAIVDAYDAMTEDRVYRKAMTKEAAIVEIKKNIGTQFDPLISRIFLEEVLDEDLKTIA